MAAVDIAITVAGIAEALSLYDVIRVWRSDTGDDDTYELITAAAVDAATILGEEDGPFPINGKTLNITVDGGLEQIVTFVTANPVAVSNAVEEINDQTTGLTAVAVGDKIRLTSNTTGTASVLEISGGSALEDLGFTLGDVVSGKDQHIDLVGSYYSYTDNSGETTSYYKVQFYNTVTADYSTISHATLGEDGSILIVANVIKALIDIVDPSGVPVEGMKVILYNVFSPPVSVGTISVLGRTVEVVTDAAGHAEIDLVRGMILDVIYAGTGIVRRIQVPDTGSEFQLWDEVSAADDNFQIQVPDIPDAVRRS